MNSDTNMSNNNVAVIEAFSVGYLKDMNKLSLT